MLLCTRLAVVGEQRLLFQMVLLCCYLHSPLACLRLVQMKYAQKVQSQGAVALHTPRSRVPSQAALHDKALEAYRTDLEVGEPANSMRTPVRIPNLEMGSPA
jgi:hypothetical protein